jgi:hypothetical protein
MRRFFRGEIFSPVVSRGMCRTSFNHGTASRACMLWMRAAGWIGARAFALIVTLLVASWTLPVYAQRGPAFSGVGTIVVVPGFKVENPSSIYLETQQGRTLLICTAAFQYAGKAVKVEGTWEAAGICADKITQVDPAELEPKRTEAPPGAPRPESYAEFCRFVASPAGTFLCTPVVNYSAGGLLFAEYYAVEAILDHGRTDLPQFLVDVNNDGKPDYCRFVAAPSSAAPVLSCALRTDAGFKDGAFKLPPGFDYGREDKPRFMADVDGDGRPDFCRFVGNPANLTLSCALQRDGGYAGPALTSAAGLNPGQDDKPRFMVDVNGDGKADYCRFVGASDAPMLSCTLATANGFAGEVSSAPGIDLGHAEMGRFMADVNGDGKADFCRFTGAQPSTRFSCILSDGHAFGPAVHQSQPLAPDTPGNTTQGVNPGVSGKPRFLVDANKDGSADYCRVVVRVYNPKPFLSCAIATRRGFGNYDISADVNLGIDDLPHLLTAVR